MLNRAAACRQFQRPINCNAAVVVYDEGVLVVDTHSRPSSALALVEQIKTVSDKPVRYAVNTHFHWDHAQGNQAYPSAFPRQVAIVSGSAREGGIVVVRLQLREQVRQDSVRGQRDLARQPADADGQGRGGIEVEPLTRRVPFGVVCRRQRADVDAVRDHADAIRGDALVFELRLRRGSIRHDGVREAICLTL